MFRVFPAERMRPQGFQGQLTCPWRGFRVPQTTSRYALSRVFLSDPIIINPSQTPPIKTLGAARAIIARQPPSVDAQPCH
jgi:hypothetical protein